MCDCDDNCHDGRRVVQTYQGELPPMKKLMSVMLGLSLLLGVATVSFAQTDTDKKEGKKKGKKKGTDAPPAKRN